MNDINKYQSYYIPTPRKPITHIFLFILGGIVCIYLFELYALYRKQQQKLEPKLKKCNSDF